MNIAALRLTCTWPLGGFRSIRIAGLAACVPDHLLLPYHDPEGLGMFLMVAVGEALCVPRSRIIVAPQQSRISGLPTRCEPSLHRSRGSGLVVYQKAVRSLDYNLRTHWMTRYCSTASGGTDDRVNDRTSYQGYCITLTLWNLNVLRS